MREIIEKKKKEKRVVKYALRKYTVGLVSVAISTSIFAPVAVSANTLQIKDGNVIASKDVATNNLVDDSVVQEYKKEAKNSVVEFLSDEEAKNMVDEVIDQYYSIQYDDYYKILAPYESSFDKAYVKDELKAETGVTPSEDEVKVALKTYYMDKLDLEDSFNKVKANLRQELIKLVTSTSYVNKRTLVDFKEKILLGLTYLEKQYSFAFGDKTAKDLILYNSGLRGEDHNALYYLVSIGNLRYTDLELRYNLKTYKEKLSSITGEENLLDFIEKAVKTYAKEASAEEWFKNSTKAWIVESESKYGTTSLYKKMAKDNNIKSHLIPLLAVSDNSIYAISTMSTVTYGLVDAYIDDVNNAKMDDLRAEMEKTAKNHEAFLNFWYRTSTVNNKLLDNPNIVVVDTLKDYGDGLTKTLWSKKTGKKALKGVREFITPLGMYSSFFMAEGQADINNNSVSLFLAKALSDRGQETYTHELTHLLDKKVFLNGYGRRQNKGAESFARGLFEIVDNAGGSLITEPIFNLNLSYELGDERIQNKSPERFQTESDIQNYMKGLMDVIYTLDYVEALSSLNQATEDKAILYNQLSLTDDKTQDNVVNDTFSYISNETAEKLKTIDDLIDNNIVSGRLAFQGILTTGTAEDNGYYVVPLFEPMYAAMQNDKGAVGDISFKRNAYELLAQYGYSDGMVAYISDKYANDEEALKAILDTKYNGSLAEFKKDMFAIRASKLSRLKQNEVFADSEELQNLMNAAVQKDLETMRLNKKYNLDINQGVGAVRALKTKILQSYLKSTDDFTTSIYKDIVVGEKIEESENIIPSTIINEFDDTMWEGETRTEQGIDGIEKVTKLWKTENGVVVGEPTIKTEVIQEMKPTIIYTGTKKKPDIEVKPENPGTGDGTENKPSTGGQAGNKPQNPGTDSDSTNKPSGPNTPLVPPTTDNEVTPPKEEETEKPSQPENKPGTGGNGSSSGTGSNTNKPGTGGQAGTPGAGGQVVVKPENNSQVVNIDNGKKPVFDMAKHDSIKIVSNKLANKKVDYIIVNGVKITKLSTSNTRDIDTIVDYNDEYYTVTDGEIVLHSKLFDTLKLSANKAYNVGVAFTDGEKIEKLTTINIVDTSDKNNTNSTNNNGTSTTVKPSTNSNSSSTTKPSTNNSTVSVVTTNKEESTSNSGSTFTYGTLLENEEADSTVTSDITADSENEVADSNASEAEDNNKDTEEKTDNNTIANKNESTKVEDEKKSNTGIIVTVIALVGAISAAVGVILFKKKK